MSQDTKDDTYEYQTDEDRTGVVRLVNYRGISFLSSGKFLVQPLYHGEILESKKVRLNCKDTEILISRQDRLLLHEMTMEFSVKTEFRPRKVYNDQLSEERLEKSEYREIIIEETFHEGSEMFHDVNVPDHLLDFLDVIGSNENVVDEESSESDEDSWADQFEEPEECSINELSVTDSYLSSFSTKSRFVSLVGQTDVTVRLPKSLSDTYTTDTELGVTAVRKLLNDVMRLEDEFERYWSLSTISQMMIESNFV
jgi:hypothetical protein